MLEQLLRNGAIVVMNNKMLFWSGDFYRIVKDGRIFEHETHLSLNDAVKSIQG